MNTPEDTGFDGRLRQIRWIHRKYRSFYDISGGLLLVALIGAFGLFLFATERLGYQMNLYTEIASVAITIFVLDKLAKLRAELQLKEQLITDMGGQSNEFALRAVRLLAKKGWLCEGLLDGEDFNQAKLERAILNEASLRGAILSNADLQDSELQKARLQGADLWGADLRGAKLTAAKLQGAVLTGTKLHHANLFCAMLNGADMFGAILKYTSLYQADTRDAINFTNARFDETTQLPDGTYWHPGADLTRFVDGTWKPDWAQDDDQPA